MKIMLQTIAFSVAFAGAGAIALQQAEHYAQNHSGSALPLPQGNPGIPDNIKAGLRDAFSGR